MDKINWIIKNICIYGLIAFIISALYTYDTLGDNQQIMLLLFMLIAVLQLFFLIKPDEL